MNSKLFSIQFCRLVFFLLIPRRPKASRIALDLAEKLADHCKLYNKASGRGGHFPSKFYVKLHCSRKYSSPTVRDFSNPLPSPTTLEISISLIHLYKCFGLRINPPPPRKFQSLLLRDYQYFLELHIQTNLESVILISWSWVA